MQKMQKKKRQAKEREEAIVTANSLLASSSQNPTGTLQNGHAIGYMPNRTKQRHRPEDEAFNPEISSL